MTVSKCLPIPATILVLCLLFLPTTSFGQRSILSSNPSGRMNASRPNRDPAAVALIMKMLKATGWNAQLLNEPIKVEGTRTLSGMNAATLANFVAKFHGIGRVRIEDANGQRIVVANGSGAKSYKDGRVRAASPQPESFTRPMILPFLSTLVHIDDSRLSIMSQGQSKCAGQITDVVVVAPMPKQFRSGVFSTNDRTNSLRVCLATETGLPVAITYSVIAESNPSGTIEITRTFADYRPVEGVLVPFAQAEGPNQTWQLSSVDLHAESSGADFDVSANF